MLLTGCGLVLAARPQADEASDVNSLLPRVLKTLEADRNEVERWTWVESVVLEKRAPDGEVRSRTAEVYEVYSKDGRRMKRPISLDLAEDSQGFGVARREEAKFLASEHRGEGDGRAMKESPFEPDKLLRCFRYEPRGREELHGALRVKVAFAPIEECLDDGSRAGRLLQQLIGTLWIDEERADVVRIEGHLRKAVSFGFGILGKVEGFEITVDREPVAPHLNMMTHVAYRARGTSFIFHQFDVESIRERSAFALAPTPQASAPAAGTAP